MQFLNLESTAEAKIYIMQKTALKIKSLKYFISSSLFLNSIFVLKYKKVLFLAHNLLYLEQILWYLSIRSIRYVCYEHTQQYQPYPYQSVKFVKRFNIMILWCFQIHKLLIIFITYIRLLYTEVNKEYVEKSEILHACYETSIAIAKCLKKMFIAATLLY